MKRYLLIVSLVLVGLLAAACAGSALDSPTVAPATATDLARVETPVPPTETLTAAAPTATAEVPAETLCVLEPIVAPTLPAVIPGYVELDEATGLHITGEYQVIDVITWTLEITGAVETPLVLTYDDLRCMPKIEQKCVLNCPGFFQDEATWAGASLQHILDLAGAKPTLEGIYLQSADGYRTFVTAAGLEAEDGFLAYEWEGEPVPILHGFPVRAVFPALDGNKWAKWLVKIEVK